jgi:hypothetical protein
LLALDFDLTHATGGVIGTEIAVGDYKADGKTLGRAAGVRQIAVTCQVVGEERLAISPSYSARR